MALVVSADHMLLQHGKPPPPPLLSGTFQQQQQSWRAPSTSIHSSFSMSKANAKSGQVAKPSFVFIDESAKSSKDKRRAIRSQAKRYAIAERSKRPREIRFVNIQGSKENLSHSDDESEDKSEHAGRDVDKALVLMQRKPILIPDLPKTGYEAARIEYGFDITLLSGLASVHVGKGASLQLQHTKLGDWLMGFREASYLDLVPSNYDASPLLQSVVNCTMAQYRRALCPEAQITEATVFRLYGKALQDLQTALNDDNRRLQADVLLATAVLQLFELLQNETSGRWSYHTLGLMHLLQMRDPSTFSQIELSLLACQLGPLINECFLRQIDCFLEHPKWSHVISQLHRHNAMVTSLLNAQAKLPRFMRIARDCIMAEGPYEPIEKIRAVEEMHGVKEFSYQWEEDLEERKRANDAVLNLHELPCAVWALQINLNRLMVCLDPLADDAQILEDETQEISEKILDWWNTSSKMDGERGDRLFTFPIPSAQIALATKFEWRCAVQGRLGYVNTTRGVIDQQVFENFTNLVKRKAPTRKYKYVEQR